MVYTLNSFISHHTDDEDDDDDSEEERDTPSYTAVSNTPTRITLTAKVSQKGKRGPNNIKVKDRSAIHVCRSPLFFSALFNKRKGVFYCGVVLDLIKHVMRVY